MQNEFTNSYTHVGASFQNISLGPESPLGSPGCDDITLAEISKISYSAHTHDDYHYHEALIVY